MKLTRNDVEKKKIRIEKYRKQLADLRSNGSDTGESVHIGFSYDVAHVLYKEQEELILSFIKREEEEIADAEIVDELEIPEDVVGLGDTISVIMQFEGEEPEETEITIADEKIGDQITVTTSSPIGLAVYGKAIGSTVFCQTPNGKLTITLLEKTQYLKR